eukprot:CAMPEP_0195512226 /NCGR_PEP_ID=MMETSP0794_2-20130614/4252_1 /TAXON_ID=515487 /ORGANISM="Stephanopyxis turris, Strain CCMP 815" /LENGTH=1612 /DNA_ID=CAMNT_0040639961 /DNA_START=347 /DNA_END=5185 /DNA_ORIENTATION=+
MDITDARTVALDGLHIQGKLEFPNTAKLTINTQKVIVEGELVMTNTDVITGTPKVKIVMTGSTEQVFEPHSSNAAGCGGAGQSCAIGKKAFVVAGGKLTINGMPDTCPSWANFQDLSVGTMPVPSNVEEPAAPEDGCTDSVLDETFPDGHMNGWSGNLGATESITNEGSYDEGTDNYLKVSDRVKTWQGPFYDLKKHADCLSAGSSYFFSSRIKLENNGTPSQCSIAGNSCPKLRINIMKPSNELVWKTVLTSGGMSADGTWFHLRGTFEWTEEMALAGNIYTMLSVDGPEAGIDISIGEIKLSLPAQPEIVAETACSNLLLNGDAESGFAIPWYSFNQAEASLTVEEEADGNLYFHLSGRTVVYSSITHELNPECTTAGSVYSFSARIWVHSDSDQLLRLMIKSFDKDNKAFYIVVPCPPSSETSGWVTCRKDITFTQAHRDSKSINILFTAQSDATSDISYDDLKMTFKTAGDVSVSLPTETNSCWGLSSEVLVTSDTMEYNQETVTKISSLNSAGVLRTTDSFPAPLGTTQSADYAGEIAILSRMISFESEDLTDASNGAHFMVYHTPGVAQTLEGVVFRNFGQQGTRARYPINFHGNGDVNGTLVSKNVIRDSNQRCVVVSGTDGITIADNVAYKTKGHCYMLEDGGETSNSFLRNLGARTEKVTTKLSGANDDKPATFYARAPGNTWEGNVAAGSFDSGFWFNVLGSVQGESASLHPDVKPNEVSITSFKNNIAHSNGQMGISTYSPPHGYTPTRESVFENNRVYRNRLYGYWLNSGNNLAVVGGIVSDNRIGVDSNHMNGLRVENLDVVGFSEEFLDIVASRTVASHCLDRDNKIAGVRLSANAKDASMSGASLINVDFSKFVLDDCENGKPIAFNPVTSESRFTASTTFSGLNFDVFTLAEKFSICDLVTAGIDDVLITDDGSLSPGGGEPGYIMSDNAALLASVSGCSIMTSTCAQYCSGTNPDTGSSSCLRKAIVAVDLQASNNVKMYVSDGTTEFSVESTHIQDSVYADTKWTKDRFYTVALPAGNYTATFKNLSGEVVWPNYALVTLGDAPATCVTESTYAFSFNVNKPSSPDMCDELVLNPSFSTSNVMETGWHHSDGGLRMVSPGSEGTANSYCLTTDNRQDWWHGPAIFLDSRCMEAGKAYEFATRMRLALGNTGGAECDTEAKYGEMRCPHGSIKTIKDGVKTSEQWGLFNAIGPWTTGAWNPFSGVFVADDAMADADQVILYIHRLRPGINIQLDDTHLKPFEVACDNVVQNGDFEGNSLQYWWYLGNARLQLVQPGYGGSNYALSTISRKYWIWGQSQVISNSCLEIGLRYEISAMVKLVSDSDGSNFLCNPTMLYLGPNHCPTIGIKIEHAGAETQYLEIAETVGPTTLDNDGWNEIYGTFTATEDMRDADSVDMYFAKAWSGIQMVIDDVSIVPASAATNSLFTCDDLIKNGDLSYGDARYWGVLGSPTLEMYGDASNWMLITKNRGLTWHGAQQEINQDCLDVGDTWIIRAKFRLVLKDTNTAVSCDTTMEWGDMECPAVNIYALSPSRSEQFHHRVRNTIKTAWNGNVLNPFEATFEVNDDMKNAEKVIAFIDRVNPSRDVIVDDFSITKA